MKPTKVTQKDILFLAFSFFVVVTAWVGFNIYHAYVTTTVSKSLQMQVVPIAGTFDTTVIEQLQTRTPITPLTESLIQQVASQSAEIEETIIIEEEISITPSPTGGVEEEVEEPTPTETAEITTL